MYEEILIIKMGQKGQKLSNVQKGNLYKTAVKNLEIWLWMTA